MNTDHGLTGGLPPLIGDAAVKANRVREAAKNLLDVLTDLGLSRHIDAAIMHVEDAEMRAVRHIAHGPRLGDLP